MDPEEINKAEWKELYKKVDMKKVLKKVDELRAKDWEYYQKYGPALDEGDWNGELTLGGIKEMILTLFNVKNRWHDECYLHCSPEVQKEINNFNPKEYLKE